jgi:hypothetical protein
MFGGNFAKGFATGLANRVAKEIDDDMEKTEDNISRLAALRLERAANNEATNKKTRQEKEAEIKTMVSYLDGNTDAAQYLIDNFSYDRAKTIAANLATQKQKLGLNPLDQIGLAQRTGKSVTLEQLIDSNTPYLSLAPLDSVKGSVAVGFGKMFGGADASMQRLEKLSEGQMVAAGIEMPSGEDALKTMPPTLQGDLKEYMLGRLDTPKEEAERLYMLANNLQAKGKKEEAEAMRTEAQSLMLIEESTRATTSTDEKWTTDKSIKNGDNLGKSLAMANGLGTVIDKKTGLITDISGDDKQRTEYIKKQSYLQELLNKYIMDNGIKSHGTAMRELKLAIADNYMISYEPPADDDGMGRFVVNKDAKLFTVPSSTTASGNIKLNTGTGGGSATTPPSGGSTTAPPSGGGAAAINAPSAAQQIVDQLLQQQPGSAKANALKNILIRKHPGTAIPQGY